MSPLFLLEQVGNGLVFPAALSETRKPLDS